MKPNGLRLLVIIGELDTKYCIAHVKQCVMSVLLYRCILRYVTNDRIHACFVSCIQM
jgi:hypothetical protein